MLKYLRNLLRHITFFLPLAKRREIDRWFRARAEMKKLRRSSVVFASYPKSGRTWLRALVSYALQGAFDLKTENLLGNKNYNALDSRVPVILFTHDHSPRLVFGDTRMKRLYDARKVVLLVRDPRDVEVSAFFQVAHRGDPLKKKIYGQHASGKDEDVFPYLKMVLAQRDRNTLTFLNRWAEMAKQDNVLVVRYEDLRVAAVDEMRRIFDFLEIQASDACLQAAVERASFAAMRKREREGSFSHENSRFGGGGKDIEDAFKVRRGKIGGYRDYMTPAEAEEIDAIIDARLAHGFGYRSDEAKALTG